MITLTTEQAQQLEEALEYARNVCAGSNWSTDDTDEAIASIRAARAQEQAEQEPVAWRFQPPNKNVRPMFDTQQHGGKWKPLYATPVRTKDLTDDEIRAMFNGYVAPEILLMFRAVIAADREKNRC